MTTDPRYPIGKFHAPATVSDSERQQFIADIEATPARMRAAVAGLTPDQLRTPYREGGWTVLQLIHHVPDSHMNAYIRFKLALTENEPTIKPYEEARWAELPDTQNTPPEISLTLLDSLHTRWVNVLRGMSAADWTRQFRHPELGIMNLDRTLALYAWHGKHHAAHITALRQQKGW
jgi:uncharacterized damage-inducible protein DinB